MEGATEAEIQKAIIQYLRLRGHFPIRINVQGVPIHTKSGIKGFRPSPMKGISDILGISKTGRFFALEVKRKKGYKVSPEQIEFIAEVKKRGGIASLVCSTEEVTALGL